MKQKVTIAIPVFNGEKYILEALQSIIDQTIKVDQILICDNQSTDNTSKIINRFKKEHENWNIKLHTNKTNIGNIRNYNKCMELCQTDYLLILSSDDRLKKETIKKQLNFFETHPELALVGGVVDYINSNGEIIVHSKKSEDRIYNKGELLEFISKTRLWVQHSAVLMKTKFTNTIGFWDSKNIGGDERFWAQVLLSYPIAFLGDTLAEERRHSEQLGNREHLRYKDKILHFETNYKVANFESNPQRIKKTKKVINDWIASQSIFVSNSVWKKTGKKKLAMKYWIYGLKKNPDYYFRRYIYWKMKTAIKNIKNK